MNIDDRIGIAADWLLDSGIQILDGHNTGGINGYYDTEERRYPYVYSEITGYGISTFVYLKKMTGKNIFIERAKLAAQWIENRALLPTGGVKPRDGTNDMYSFSAGNAFTFDTAMVLYGFASLYEETNDKRLLPSIRNMSNFLINMQNPDGTFNAYMDNHGGKINSPDKWSNQPSAFHAKVALSLMEAHKILGDKRFLHASRDICEKSSDFLKGSRFITSADGMTDTHPNCYAAEGLFFAGMNMNEPHFIDMADKAVSGMFNVFDGILPCKFGENYANKNMRIDTVAQLLRLSLIINNMKNNHLDKINALYKILEQFQSHEGGFFYGNDSNGKKLNHLNAWVTMFALQAMSMYRDYLNGRKIETKPFV